MERDLSEAAADDTRKRSCVVGYNYLLRARACGSVYSVDRAFLLSAVNERRLRSEERLGNKKQCLCVREKVCCWLILLAE